MSSQTAGLVLVALYIGVLLGMALGVLIYDRSSHRHHRPPGDPPQRRP